MRRRYRGRSRSAGRKKAGRTFLCLASGPSLTRDDAEKAKRKAAEVIAVNDTWRVAPWADHLYACDAKWWRYHGDTVLREFKGRKWTQRENDKDEDQIQAIERFGLEWKEGARLPGLGRTRLHYGDNGGYQAINLAYLLGATEILLLGYDMQKTNGRTHFFGDHPDPLNVGGDYTDWARQFAALAADLEAENVRVTNYTRETALTCFPRGSL